MIRIPTFLSRIAADRSGSTVIETALVLPPLLVMAMGTFEVSRMVARQNELQKAANEASDAVLAYNPQTDAAKTALQQVIMTSTGLSADKVTVTNVYRCGTDASFVTLYSSCSGTYSIFVKVTISDSYTPAWTSVLKMGSPITYNVTRQVQVS